MIKTYTYKIRHEEKYSQWIERTLSQLRYVYNLAKQTKEDSYAKGLSLTNYDLQKQFTQCKKEPGFEWLREASSCNQQSIFDRLDRAYKLFYRGGGYPKWASKKNWKSIPFKRIKQIHNGFFKLPKLGVVKVFNPNIIKGDLRTASIIKKADGYYLNIQVKLEEKEKQVKGEVAIDRGITYFAVTSDGEYIDNPKINEKSEKKLRILNRKLSRAKKGSNRRDKVINQLQKLYLKRQRQRLDFLHKLTTNLANNYENVILEDLKVSKMVQDKNYSKSISDLGWYKFEELLSYKTNVIKVNPAYTSQTCSECGSVDKNSRKSQSIFKCTSCNFEMNADENACQEILKRGRADLTEVNVNH